MSSEPERTLEHWYRFCPYDGTKLVRKPGGPEGGLPTCERCGFVDYRNPKPCVAVLVERDGRILLVRRAVEPAMGKWDIPGGFTDATESAEQAAAREISEETGLHLTNIHYIASVVDVYGPRETPTLNLCFSAEVAGGDPTPQSDAKELAWFKEDQLPEDLAFPHQHELLAVWREWCRDGRD